MNFSEQFYYFVFYFLTFIYSCIVNIFPSYDQQDATFLNILFLQMLYVFQAVPPPIIRSTKTVHTASGIVNQYRC